MLLKKADALDLLRLALQIFVAAREFLGPAARDASDRHTDPFFETIKTTALANGAIPPHGADQKHSRFFRSIRVTE
jgi:hypothetical protein